MGKKEYNVNKEGEEMKEEEEEDERKKKEGRKWEN